MKIRIPSVSFLATLAIVVCVLSWGGMLSAQNAAPPPSSQDQQAQPPSQENPPAQDPSARPSQQPSDQGQGADAKASGSDNTQVFMGTVVKSGNKYMLQDDSGKIYDIDHQDDVKKFEGKKVRVKGTLDETGKKILVK